MITFKLKDYNMLPISKLVQYAPWNMEIKVIGLKSEEDLPLMKIFYSSSNLISPAYDMLSLFYSEGLLIPRGIMMEFICASKYSHILFGLNRTARHNIPFSACLVETIAYCLSNAKNLSHNSVRKDLQSFPFKFELPVKKN